MAADTRWMPDRPPDRRRLLYAHRGAADELPENTLPAFALAVELGVDALEMDAHRTADGHMVISHDPSGARMCGVDREIRASSLAEVRGWDAGMGFMDAAGGRPHAGLGIRVPTLDEVLDAFPKMRLNLDLKQRAPSMARDVVALLRRHRAEERVCLASFSLRPLAELRVAGYRGPLSASDVEIAAALALPSRLWRRLPGRASAAQLPLRYGRLKLATPHVVAKLQRAGLRVDFWTVNDPAEAAALLGMGADGIMTDSPRALAPLFRAAPE